MHVSVHLGLQHQTLNTESPYGLPLNFTTLPQKLRESGTCVCTPINITNYVMHVQACLDLWIHRWTLTYLHLDFLLGHLLHHLRESSGHLCPGFSSKLTPDQPLSSDICFQSPMPWVLGSYSFLLALAILMKTVLGKFFPAQVFSKYMYFL